MDKKENSANKRKTGGLYEQKAAKYLSSQGVKILECNYRNRIGEIDLIGQENDYLVFFEVKYRKDNQTGDPAEAVTYSKHKTICKVADYYRMCHAIGESAAVRYDVIAVCGKEWTWYRNAFAHIYTYR